MLHLHIYTHNDAGTGAYMATVYGIHEKGIVHSFTIWARMNGCQVTQYRVHYDRDNRVAGLSARLKGIVTGNTYRFMCTAYPYHQKETEACLQ